MKVCLYDFAKIRKAEMTIDAITVIVGPNDSGKSTIGKALDAVFSSVSDLKSKMRRSRKTTIIHSVYSVLTSSGIGTISFEDIYDNRIEGLIDNFVPGMSQEDILNNVKKIVDKIANSSVDEAENDYFEKSREALVNNMCDAIKNVTDVADSVFEKRIITNQFSTIFNGNINNIFSNLSSDVKVEIKEKTISMGFENEICTRFDNDIIIKNKSFYIENPYVLDKMNFRRNPLGGYYSQQEFKLLKCLLKEKDNNSDSALRGIITDNRIKEVMDVLNKAAPGSISRNEKYEYTIPGGGKLDIRSLSTGLKSFAIIKRLLEVGDLNDKDLLILDEPEIHLHPEWQHLYAEVIVLLQKSYDFHILVTTHSSKFLEAIEFYSKKYGLSERCHYYMAKKDGNHCTSFEDVTYDTSKIYYQFLEPSLRLEMEENEMEESGNNE